MKKVLVIYNGTPQVYDVDTERSAEFIATSLGVTDPSLYAEFDSADLDPACCNFPGAFTLSDGVVGFDLDVAKDSAVTNLKAQASAEQQAAMDGYSLEALSAQSALAKSSRILEIQAVIDNVNALSTALQSKIAAVSAATTIGELEAAINPNDED